MKKYFYILAAVLCLGTAAKAAPGDTTWVYANNVQLGGYGNYDSMVTFPAPGVTYRKIYMIFTLGKYICPGSPTYCGDWDYTVQNYLMIPGGDTLELGRLITPYANAGAPRTPFTWTQHYVYDVTEYASVLHNANAMRIAYSGYSGGFTANIKFAFIEGTPDRNVLGVHKLWGGSYGYGGTPDINVHFPAMTETPPAGTKTADVKFTVTGHGSDANGCCEFMTHNYQVMLNGSSVATKTIWRNDCGMNQLYPQSGTWIYDRANWCPGSIVYSGFHNLPGIAPGTPFDVSMLFDAYTGGGSYTTEGTLVYYGAMNKTLDASLEDIIAPTNDENHFRQNPIAGSPIVHVKNRGSSTINSLSFQYEIKDSVMYTANWVGTLDSLQETDITLPSFYQLNEITGTPGIYSFVAKIVSVNGVSDDDSTNNILSSKFLSAPRWPSSFRIAFQTNNEAVAAGSTISETSWIIYDLNNAIVAQRTNASISTYYSDTINATPGYYRLAVYDSGCNGLYWWANPTGVTGGYLNVKKVTGFGGNILMNGYSYSGNYANDFGCGFSQYFYVGTPVDMTGIKNINEVGEAAIATYPNPAQSTVTLDISGIEHVKGTIRIFDALGRVALETRCNSDHQQVNVAGLITGVYTLQFMNDVSGEKLVTRLLISK